MKKFLIFSIITGVVVLVTSCSKKSSEENSSNTIAFEIKHYKKTYGNCDSTNGPCAEVKFEYPLIINGPNEDAKKKVNENIMNTLLTPVYNDNSSYQNFDSLADDLIEDYKSFINEFPDSYQQWALEKKITVENAADTILSLNKTEYSFLGGAHPSTFTNYINFNMLNGKAIKLSNLFKVDFNDTLNKIGEKKFRESQNLKPNEDLNDAGYWFEKNKFALNDNFLIKNDGLLFLFNPYEVAAYAMGNIEVFIPFKEIKNIMKSEKQ